MTVSRPAGPPAPVHLRDVRLRAGDRGRRRCGQALALGGVVDVREAGVVELEVRAPVVVPGPRPRPGTRRRGRPRTRRGRGRRPRRSRRGRAEVDHRRRRDRELRGRRGHESLQRPQVVAEDDVVEGDRSVDLHERRAGARRGAGGARRQAPRPTTPFEDARRRAGRAKSTCANASVLAVGGRAAARPTPASARRRRSRRPRRRAARRRSASPRRARRARTAGTGAAGGSPRGRRGTAEWLALSSEKHMLIVVILLAMWLDAYGYARRRNLPAGIAGLPRGGDRPARA